ncbi:MAG: DUF4349 domain-containing protein [Chromatiales bacterium]|nr:DUF4349 domain-containing protein [Chromatiales bacterium]
MVHCKLASYTKPVRQLPNARGHLQFIHAPFTSTATVAVVLIQPIRAELVALDQRVLAPTATFSESLWRHLVVSWESRRVHRRLFAQTRRRLISQAMTSPTNAQDLTRQIIDTDARLKAQAGLRRRPEGLLETRNAGLEDLLGIERELARVNGDIDALTTTIRTLRLRVALYDLAISYETRERSVTATTFDPLTRALAGFLGNFTAALGAAITAFATGLPWLLLAGLVLWLWVKLLRPRFRRARGR